jgi:hypothetical protein
MSTFAVGCSHGAPKQAPEKLRDKTNVFSLNVAETVIRVQFVRKLWTSG